MHSRLFLSLVCLCLLLGSALGAEPKPVYALALSPDDSQWTIEKAELPAIAAWKHRDLDLSLSVLVLDSGDCKESPESLRQAWFERFLAPDPGVQVHQNERRELAAFTFDWLLLTQSGRVGFVLSPLPEVFAGRSCPRYAYFVLGEGRDDASTREAFEAALSSLSITSP